MPSLKVVDMSGKEVGSMDLSDAVFGTEINGPVLHAAVKTYLSNQRLGTQSTLTRTEVSGGGRKPRPQKGSGRSRQGSTRAPQWRHGGIALGPKPRSYKTTLNKKVRQLALKSALSSKVADSSMIIVDNIRIDEYKTKTMIKMLTAIGASKKALVVIPARDEKILKSFSNIPGVKTAYPNTINVYDILNCDSFVVAQSAAEMIQGVYDK